MINLPDLPGLKFEEKRHIYTLDGQQLPSVTTLMRPLSGAVYKGIDDAVLNRAAARGTAVHNAIENYLTFGIEDVDPDHAGYFMAFLRWFSEYNPQVIASEYRLYHKFMGYAGTADLICVIGGKLYVIDYKTTQRIEELLVRVQLKAYSQALGSLGAEPQRAASLHLKRDGTFDFQTHDGGAESWQVFSSLLTVLKYKQKISRR